MVYLYNVVSLTALMALGIGQVSSMNEACQKLATCNTGMTVLAAGGAKTKASCMVLRDNLDCFEKYTKECDTELIVTPFRSSLRKLEENYQKWCGEMEETSSTEMEGTSSTETYEAIEEPDESCVDLVKCIPSALNKFTSESDIGALCKHAPKAFECFKTKSKLCKNDMVRNLAKSNVEKVESAYGKKCNASGKLTVSASVVLASVCACAMVLFLELFRSS